MNEESLGTFKTFNPQNNYYAMSLRGRNPIELIEYKIRAHLSFRGTNQPISYGYFKSKTGYNSKFKNTKQYANHFGEYIACIILKQLGKEACKVDLGVLETKNRYSNKQLSVDGILSHYQLSQEQIFKPICNVIEEYKLCHPKKYREQAERGKTFSEQNYSNIEIILASIEDALTNENQREKIPEIRKNFFDMCIFDLKFANRDRHDENFGLRINQTTTEIDFYPLFDNEQILGFQEDEVNVKKYLSSEEDYDKFKKRDLTSCIGFPNKAQKVTSKELLEYLLEHYYEETMDSIRDISRYKLEDLNKVMDLCPTLSDAHKELARKIFVEREKEIADTVKEFERKKSDGPSL